MYRSYSIIILDNKLVIKMNPMLKNLLLDITSQTLPDRIPILQNFFQTQKWGYAEGDKFLWLYVPEQRKIAKKYYKFLNLDDVQFLLDSEFHEHRFVGLIILMLHYRNANTEISCEDVFDFYIENLENINNWDLVDVSAPNIVGDFLWNYKIWDVNLNKLSILDKLVVSKNLWRKRVAIVSTLKFIRNGNIEKTLELCEKLLYDDHHLIHKACGWMLREAWKKQPGSVEVFLDNFANKMARTMLRYSIEQMGGEKRKIYLKM